jgi:hypothetical protein
MFARLLGNWKIGGVKMKVTIEELCRILDNFPDDYVVKIHDGTTIGAIDKTGKKRTGSAIFVDGGILLIEKPSKIDEMFED